MKRWRWVRRAGMAASVACLLFGFAASVAAETMVVTVRDALERALENDDGLLQDRLSLRIAELELQAAEESTYLPSIGLNVALPELSASGWDSAASGSLSVRLGLPWGTGGTISAGLSFDADLETLVFGETTWQLGLSETVDFGSLSSAADSLESKRQAVETAKRSVQDALGDLVRSVLTDYAEILSLQLQWESDSTSVESTAADLESVKQLIDGGFRSEADLVDARLRVLEAEIQVEKSRQAYEDAVETFARETLGLETGFEPADIVLDMESLKSAAQSLLDTGEITDDILADTESVRTALSKLQSAEEDLADARADALPQLTIAASADADAWSVGFGVSFDLFAPDRWTNVEIAKANLELAEAQYAQTWRNAENEILGLARDLREAIQNIELLALEDEKWTLDEAATTAKYDADLLSIEEWDEFSEELQSFRVTAKTREVSLLTAYLAYREVLAMDLNWEEWLP